VFRESPVASATLAWPPRPNITTNAAATSLRCRSFNSGKTNRKNPAKASLVICTTQAYDARLNQSRTLTGERHRVATVCRFGSIRECLFVSPADVIDVSEDPNPHPRPRTFTTVDGSRRGAENADQNL
jgi:hypothetical protein